MVSMEYIFLVVAAAWSLQFLLAYWQLQRFHRQLAELRKLGRCSVGMYGNRWRGRTYAVLVIDAQDRVRHAASLRGWTVFTSLQPLVGLDGIHLDDILAAKTPIAPMRRPQWLALQHAAQFLKESPASNLPISQSNRLDQRA
jgi:DNA-binding transcriptional regulator of glucitol operon